MDIMTGISAVSTALDIAKKLKELEKQYNDAEFKLQIAELLMALADAKAALAEARNSLIEKDDEIRALKDAKAAKIRTVQYRGYNFGIDAAGNSIGRPFCPVCEKKGIQIQLIRATSTKDMCPSCKAPFGGHPYKLPVGFAIPDV